MVTVGNFLALTIEQSSAVGSVALLDGAKIIAEREWDSLADRGGGMFEALKGLFADADLKPADVVRFVIDVGPGAYGGLRASFAAVRAMALPGEQKIFALTSAETLAFEIMNEFSAACVQVVGDARRQQLWTCVYEKQGEMPAAQSAIRLVPEDGFLPAEGAVMVTSDWTRLAAKLKAAAGWGTRLIEESRSPKAGWLGRLAHLKMGLNISGEPLRPIYLHAAVGGGKTEVSNQ